MKIMKIKKSKFFDKRFWLDFILPNRCAFCKEIIPWDKQTCESCLEKIPYIDKKLCKKCGKAGCICERGINYDAALSIAWYDDFMQSAVVKFKLSSPENFSLFFAEKICYNAYQQC